ncbi:GTP-binding protein [Clostridium tetanomorphum]|uniref:Probable GTP-binding protein EngB n=1 Tax=Clostridium tetanomorphum TaxID=1553 RepID=A0A923EAV1_CLOTT|nr:ribosome biogenesis GTP-binding protein YihA/YsxC [Clostridium tetanomorphum]KAJ51341.1 GTP-binding protein YsxC [Clostridium tetanomorphum DSM 665]MBC2399842.1 YihA family ribosome biogenesis GTP-binding protein [Clostridium tetanomorphum]MBP1866006.1 GTP-binding protein [Clostridium tetanomorphum]NRS85940.1 GTP-binding protein [Clostridium tetanomorphum]NRZ96050.1 GTP-binding protein [Clostridium tetanomorphum]
MEIKQAEFVKSAVTPDQYPESDLIEIAFVGRSNVGKSSLINNLTNRRKLVKVSSTPGKTKLINFFLINNSFCFVDLPGYGYAKVSKQEKLSWSKTIENYLLNRPQLKKIILLVDCRHKPTEDDITMYNWIKHYGYDSVVVATKSDKLNRSELFKSEKLIRETLGMDKEEKLIFYSTLKKRGKEELLDNISGYLQKTEE